MGAYPHKWDDTTPHAKEYNRIGDIVWKWWSDDSRTPVLYASGRVRLVQKDVIDMLANPLVKQVIVKSASTDEIDGLIRFLMHKGYATSLSSIFAHATKPYEAVAYFLRMPKSHEKKARMLRSYCPPNDDRC